MRNKNCCSISCETNKIPDQNLKMKSTDCKFFIEEGTCHLYCFGRIPTLKMKNYMEQLCCKPRMLRESSEFMTYSFDKSLEFPHFSNYDTIRFVNSSDHKALDSYVCCSVPTPYGLKRLKYFKPMKTKGNIASFCYLCDILRQSIKITSN